MIAHNTISLTSEVGAIMPLCLAPYGVKELSQFIPVDVNVLPYEPVNVRDKYTDTPDNVLEAMAQQSIQEVGAYTRVCLHWRHL